MPRPNHRIGRFLTVALLGAALASAFLVRSGRPNPGAALAERPDPDSQAVEAADTLDLVGLQDKFQAIAHRVGPSVVAISAAETANGSDSSLRAEEMTGEKLEEWLGKTTRTVGTGFVIAADGYILTNEHVIEDSQQYWVTTDDHRVYPAIVVGADPRADLAVLKIPAEHLPVVKFSKALVDRGQWTITLGNPYGLATEGDMAMSVGIVSATDRSLPKLASKENRLYSNLIQTTAQINPGNSGGPLFDVNGEVIGINTAVILPQKQTNGIGFAIPISRQLLTEIDDLRQGREIIYGYVGVIVSTPTERDRRIMGVVDPIGVHIDSVESDSPAAAALRTDDIVLRIDGQVIQDSDHFVRLVGAAPLDKPATLLVARDNMRLMVAVTPTKRPMQFAISQQNQRLRWRGMVLGPIPTTGATDAASKIGEGVLVVDIDKDSPMHKQKIVAGSIITAVANRPVASLLDLQKILNDVTPDQCEVRLADPKAEVISMRK